MNYEKLKERRVLMEDNKLIIYKNSEGNIQQMLFIKMKLYGCRKKECQRFLNVSQII